MFPSVYLCSVAALFTLSLVISDGSDLPGHMQPIGSHRPPWKIETLLSRTKLTASSFYYDYVKQNKPVKFSGLLNDSEVLRNWQDDDYLRTQFGHSTVLVEKAKKENRSLYADQMTWSEYLDKYKMEDIYAIGDISREMAEEWPLPPFLLCGGYIAHLSQVYLWFSSGGTKSVLHTDSFENLHCVVSGTKKFVLIESNYSTIIGPEHSSQGYYNVDVEVVDMNKYPRLAEIPWYEVIVEPGDCLYLPFEWIHHVDSSGRNMGINLWWVPFQFDDNDCDSSSNHGEFGFLGGNFEPSSELGLKMFLSRCAREDGIIHAIDVLERNKNNPMKIFSIEVIIEVMEILVPGSNGVIQETDLNLNITPKTKFKEAMEYLMSRYDQEDNNNLDEDWEGGGEHSHDEL